MDAKTERADHLFRASENGEGKPFISTELRHEPDLTVMSRAGFLGFDRYDESLENALIVADFLNKHVRWTNGTAFSDHPLYGPMQTRFIGSDK